MTIKKRLALIGIVPYQSGVNVQTPYEDAGLRWLFDSAARSSLVSYWRTASGGIVDIDDSEVFGWFWIDNADVRRDIVQQSRSAAAQKACDVAAGVGVNVGGFDGLIFFVGGNVVNAGATSVRVDGRVIPVALLDDKGQHNFMAHEVGHVIGLDHSYRPDSTAGGYVNGEYGDPTDIMSANTFGGYGVGFSLPHDPKSGIAANAGLWTEAGPGPAMATLWRYAPGFPAAQPWMSMLPPRAQATQVTLQAPSSGGRNPRMVVMPTPNASGWYTVELRKDSAWDRGLQFDLGSSTDMRPAPGLVIHRIVDVGSAAQGPAWPRSQQVNYHATIPLPSAGDDDWDNGQLAVRVLDADMELGVARILVGETLPDTAAVRAKVVTMEGAETRSPDGTTDLVLVGPGCGKASYTCEFVDTPMTVVVDCSAIGFQTPQFAYSVNGVSVGTWAKYDQPAQSGLSTATFSVEVPTAYRAAETRDVAVTFTWTITGNRLTLNLPGGTGKFNAEITIAAADRIFDTNVRLATAMETVDVLTRRIDLPQEAKDAQDACEKTMRDAIEGELEQRRPAPGEPVFIPERDWAAMNPEQLAEALVAISRLERDQPRVARELGFEAAKELGVHTQDLSDIAARIGGKAFR